MRPILMKGHERPLAFLRYNRDGNLLSSCAKDPPRSRPPGSPKRRPPGDLPRKQRRRMILRHVPRLGAPTHGVRRPPGSGRSVEFAVGDALAVATADNFMDHVPTFQVNCIAEDVEEQTEESAVVISGIKGRINRAVWGPLRRTIITAGEDATIRIWD